MKNKTLNCEKPTVLCSPWFQVLFCTLWLIDGVMYGSTQSMDQPYLLRKIQQIQISLILILSILIRQSKLRVIKIIVRGLAMFVIYQPRNTRFSIIQGL